MMPRTRVTVLAENTAAGPGLLAEHGLAYWIEHDGRNVLFDTGQGGVLAGNAYKLGIRLHDLDALILSHGHYDHTGGVAEALKTARSMRTFIHPAAFARKFIRNADGTAKEIGMPYRSARIIQDRRNQLIASVKPTCAVNGLTVTGSVPRPADFEDTGGPFFLDEACMEPDPLEDDQSVFLETSEGTVVLLGCAHAGVVNTLNYIRPLTDNRPICAVIGGMHLVAASPARIERTVEEFRALDVKQLAPAHCTGTAATIALWSAFPGRCQPCHVGTRFEFD